MKTAKRIALNACFILIVVLWAILVDGVALVGSPAYLGSYPAERLCKSLQPGMDLRDVEARIYQIGRPSSITYGSGRFVFFSLDSGCTLDVDPTTKRIIKISASRNPLVF